MRKRLVKLESEMERLNADLNKINGELEDPSLYSEENKSELNKLLKTRKWHTQKSELGTKPQLYWVETS